MNDEIFENILSFKNTETLDQALPTILRDRNANILIRMLSILNKPTLTSIITKANDVLLVRMLVTAATTDIALQDKTRRVSLIVSCLTSSNRLVETFSLMTGQHVALVICLVSTSELSSVMAMMTKDVLMKTLPFIDDVNLGYILSTISCLSLVRTLVSSKS
jgi:hypothetical protein